MLRRSLDSATTCLSQNLVPCAHAPMCACAPGVPNSPLPTHPPARKQHTYTHMHTHARTHTRCCRPPSATSATPAHPPAALKARGWSAKCTGPAPPPGCRSGPRGPSACAGPWRPSPAQRTACAHVACVARACLCLCVCARAVFVRALCFPSVVFMCTFVRMHSAPSTRTSTSRVMELLCGYLRPYCHGNVAAGICCFVCAP